MSPNPTSACPRLLTIKQAAEHLNVSERTVWRLIETCKLRARKIGRSTRIATEDLEKLIDSS
jgi:excisionase family DNA binding protein